MRDWRAGGMGVPFGTFHHFSMQPRQQQAQAIRLRYVDEFSTVLSASQVSRFFEVENDIQKKLLQRRQRAYH